MGADQGIGEVEGAVFDDEEEKKYDKNIDEDNDMIINANVGAMAEKIKTSRAKKKGPIMNIKDHVTMFSDLYDNALKE